MLLASSVQQQCKIVDLGIAPDNEEDLDKALSDAISSGIDILLTSGGVSMGDRDFVKPILERKGTVHFNKVHKNGLFQYALIYAVSTSHFLFMDDFLCRQRFLFKKQLHRLEVHEVHTFQSPVASISFEECLLGLPFIMPYYPTFTSERSEILGFSKQPC